MTAIDDLRNALAKKPPRSSSGQASSASGQIPLASHDDPDDGISELRQALQASSLSQTRRKEVELRLYHVYSLSSSSPLLYVVEKERKKEKINI